MEQIRPSHASLSRRSGAWFILIATGNVMVLSVGIVLSGFLQIPVLEYLTFLHTFAGPAYTPTLLFFTTVLSVLAAVRGSRGADTEDDDANRLIARPIEYGLAAVLSFASTMVFSDPTSLAQVLFALLLGYVTYVLAERIAPPRVPSTETRFQNAQADRARRTAWAVASLGIGWPKNSERRIWPTVALFAAAPVVALTASGVLISSMMWGTEWALSADSVFMFALCALGASTLTLAWCATANKAESPSSRAWSGGAFIAFGVIASGSLAIVFFLAGNGAPLFGGLIIVVMALEAAALWLPLPWVGARALRRVSATITWRSLTKVEQRLAKAREEWHAELAAQREAQGFWGKVRRRLRMSS